jgi:hypothetical protein
MEPAPNSLQATKVERLPEDSPVRSVLVEPLHQIKLLLTTGMPVGRGPGDRPG